MYKIRGNLPGYIDLIKDSYKIVENLNVLELASCHGEHSNIILSHNPLSLTITEPHPVNYKKLKELFPNLTILQEDAYDTLSKDTKFDVVVCCGLLYHFHSPLYFLELVANNAQPKYFILETFVGYNTFVPEEVNVHGNRIVLNNKKYIKTSMRLQKKTLLDSMNDLGYKCIENIDFNSLTNIQLPKTKQNGCFFIFEKVD